MSNNHTNRTMETPTDICACISSGGSVPDSLAVFGYGSLIWRPGFQFSKKESGSIHGYERRFWQGNVTHRGVPGMPGRVATLVEEEEGMTLGVTYHIEGKSQVEHALKHLICREVKKGGYELRKTLFHPLKSNAKPYEVYVFFASSDNHLYLGPASAEQVAEDIVRCRGDAGHNLEYLFRLVDSLREISTVDYHLEKIEDACHRKLGRLLESYVNSHKCLLQQNKDCKTCVSSSCQYDGYVLDCFRTRHNFISKHLPRPIAIPGSGS